MKILNSHIQHMCRTKIMYKLVLITKRGINTLNPLPFSIVDLFVCLASRRFVMECAVGGNTCGR